MTMAQLSALHQQKLVELAALYKQIGQAEGNVANLDARVRQGNLEIETCRRKGEKLKALHQSENTAGTGATGRRSILLAMKANRLAAYSCWYCSEGTLTSPSTSFPPWIGTSVVSIASCIDTRSVR